MTTIVHSLPVHERPPEVARAFAARAVDAVSLAVLLAIIVLRPLISESYDSGGSSMTRALGQVSDASPLTTLVFDTLILLAAVACCAVRAWTGAVYRRTGLEWGTLLVVIAAVISCACAGQKRLAINGTIDWICYPILTITLVQLLRSDGLRRLVVALVLAGACAQAVQCLEQATIGNAETWQHYLSMKEDFWKQQGVELDAPTVELFERRMQSRESQGFLPHSNVTGAYLILCALVGAGVVWDQWRNRNVIGPSPPSATLRRPQEATLHWLGSVVGAMAVVVLLAAAYTTGSLGALVSGVAGAALGVVLHFAGPWIAGHRRAALLIGWGAAITGVLGFVAYGLARDAFPHMSLTFRWQYWKITAPMIADHWWAGVGRENFGRHYLFYKPIDAPEEISNPHNVFVQALAEWGVVGLAGMLLMLVGTTAMLARPVAANSDASEQAAPIRALWYAAFVALVLVIVRPNLLGADDANYAYYMTMTALIPAALGFAVFFPSRGEGQKFSPLQLALPVGLFAMLLHDQISFALFVPGTATTFFALLGCALAVRTGDPDVSPSRYYETLAAIAAAILLIIVVGLGITPVSRGQTYLAQLQSAAPNSESVTILPDDPYVFLAADRYDPALPLRLARHHLARVAGSPYPEAEFRSAWTALDHAIALDPHQPALHRLLAGTCLELATATQNSGYSLAAVEFARRALALYPNDPDGLIFLAEMEEQAMAHDPSLRDSAIAHYGQALELDGQRAWFESIRRFNDRKKTDIRERMERLKDEGPPAQP